MTTNGIVLELQYIVLGCSQIVERAWLVIFMMMLAWESKGIWRESLFDRITDQELMSSAGRVRTSRLVGPPMQK